MTSAEQSTTLDRSEKWIGLIFWVVIIGAGLFWYFNEDRAEVLLDISTEPELVTGLVSFKGSAVTGGAVHVRVTEAGSRRYLSGTTLIVNENGRFSSKGEPSLGLAGKTAALRVSATFRGTLVEKKKDDEKITSLSGESVLYLNSQPPIAERFLWGVAIVAAVLLFLQLLLFTGNLSPQRARGLFVIMYFFTFFSLVLPVAVSLVVAQNKYLVDAMENSPLGLVKARTKVLSEPQWLVNIGGTVVPDRKAFITTATAVPGEPAAGTGTTGDTTAGKAPEGDIAEEPISLGKMVEGGVAVPFYVLLLAMFGAGINMTLKVPEIQLSYEDVLSKPNGTQFPNPITAALRFVQRLPEAPAESNVVHSTTAAGIRRELIENYMYLLSAPLLAIAMYYLLQLVAEQVTQSVLVIMGFATGLVSNAVIAKIIEVAEERLPSKARRILPVVPSNAEVAAKAAEAESKQAEAQAAARMLEQARAKQSAAEVSAKAAEEAEHYAKQKQASVEAAADADGAMQAAVIEAKEVAGRAALETAARKADAENAVVDAARAAQAVEAKELEARAAATAAQAARAQQAAAQAEAAANILKQAEAKQSDARAAVQRVEETADRAVEKQANAEEALKAAVQQAHAAAVGAKQMEADPGIAPRKET
jgi:hypothetical protein